MGHSPPPEGSKLRSRAGESTISAYTNLGHFGRMWQKKITKKLLIDYSSITHRWFIDVFVACLAPFEVFLSGVLFGGLFWRSI